MGGSNIEVVSKSQNMSFFVGHFMKKSENKKAHFLGFGDIRVGGGGGIFNCLQETKYELFLFCKHS